MTEQERPDVGRWAERISTGETTAPEPRRPRAPITARRIVDTALDVIATEGYDALTMRRVASALGTGPASLYAHVRNKADLDDLLIGTLCARVALPEPDPTRWRAQVLEVCAAVRDEYLRYPGISRATLSAAPTGVDVLRLGEGLLAIMLAGGVPPRAAAWASDAAILYVGAYSSELSFRTRTDAPDQRTVVDRLRELPADRFPNTVAHADDLGAGVGHERFVFTVGLLLDGLGAAPSDD
ncbi:TetR/AcrR family transcriptional regulator [Curtobacterium sp. Leaf261]|uniref:TetR/AcrR family transcriptional regulator n=1 Tax=Curtobacterium sp. Leaf261 TaxID=1736311 RepID=UPI0006F8AC16|nr:TetR family transcriptional regulator [Curtobacterium sp. Leaf261]KQO64981.1 TetR family transcriptional regulator [Curtobacterium sp. Leaf261]